MRKYFFVLYFFGVYSVCISQTIKEQKPMPIEPIPETEIYFDTVVIDEYRNLENMQDSLVKNWYPQQNNYADIILSSISEVDSLMLKMEEIDNRQSYYIEDINILENGNYFYLKKEKDEKWYKLYYRKSFNDLEILLYDPITFQKLRDNEYHINYIKPSWDGDFILISLSHSGNEISEMIVVDVKSKAVLPEILDNAWPSSFLGVSWLPDSSGFIYLQFPISDINNKDFKKDTQSVLYKLGDEPNNVKVLLSSKSHPKLNIQSNDYPIVAIKSKNDPYLVAYIASVKNFWDSYLMPIENLSHSKSLWKEFYSKEDMVYTNTGVFKDSSYIYISALKASNLQIASISLQNLIFDSPEILIPAKLDEVIDEFKINADGIYFTTIRNGVESRLYYFNNNTTSEIILPKKSGKINLSIRGSKFDELWLSSSGWITSDERYAYVKKYDEFILEELAPGAEFKEFDKFVVEEIQIPSHDGVLVPLSIIYNSELKRNGNNSTLFYGYGAYGDAINPFFSPLFLTWVEEGGILCVPHVRGGGEKGDDWHKAGYKSTKMNTWKDLIASVEYMIENKFTSKNNTVVYSSSAGGIMVGRAITERPELFAAAIVDVGVLNPLRRESFSGSSNYQEYGTVTDSVEFHGILAMDPYMHLQKGIEYPAGLFITGMNDSRLAPWMTGKFVAKMQAYTVSDKPVLYKVEDDAGHSTSASFDDFYRKWAQMFAFGFWQTGNPRYRIKL